MKTDLATTILVAVVGFIVAYLLCGLVIPEIEAVSFKELKNEASFELVEPNENIFNFRALNPTVEVYVGNQQSTEGGEQNGSSD